MSNSAVADRLPLTGADCMLRAFDREARRFHGASHASQLVLRLAPGFDIDAFRSAIEATARDAPIVHARIRRPVPYGAPIYELARTSGELPLRRHEVGPCWDRVPPRDLVGPMNELFSGSAGEILRFDLVSYEDRSCDLALTWLHMLLDGTGSENFVRALSEVGCGVRQTVGLEVGADSNCDHLTLRERGDKARDWQAYLTKFARHLPGSLAGPLRRVPQALRYRLTTLSEDETGRVAELAKRKAGFLTPVMFYMAAAIRAHHRLFVERGRVPESYVVPLPVNTRPRGQEGAIFRTHVSMLWFQVRPAQVEDFDALLEELKRQRHDSIKRGLVESGSCAIEFARYVPADVFRRMVRRTLGGELCSFFFAFTGNFLDGVDEFFGAPIRSGFHAPAVLPSPGSCAAMSVHRGRFNLTHVYQEAALSEAEVELFAETMRSELLRE